MRPDPDELDRLSLQRRQEVLGLPVITLRRHGLVLPPDGRSQFEYQADYALGIGPDDAAYACWLSPTGETGTVTRQVGGKTSAAWREITNPPRFARFAQPLPDGQVLVAGEALASARVWSDAGDLVATGDLGGFACHVVADELGRLWVGYIDEAIGSAGPPGHGFARFSRSLRVEWVYPHLPDRPSELPSIVDCYVLNVVGRDAYCYAYDRFHLLHANNDGVRDRGAVPQEFAQALLIDGENAATLGGPTPEYDLLTPLRVTSSGVERAGSPSRLVMPDGMELPPRARTFCRGSELHIVANQKWYRLSLADIPSS